MSWHLRKALSPSTVLLTPHTLLTSPPLPSFVLCAPMLIPVAGFSLRVLLLSHPLSSSSQHHSTFLLACISCQSSCAPPNPLYTLSTLSLVWQTNLGFPEDQPCQGLVTSLGMGEHGILSGKTQELSLLLVPRHSALRLHRFGDFTVAAEVSRS